MAVTLLVHGLFFSGFILAADSPQRIRIGFPSHALSILPFYVAKERGFLQKVGLEAEYIQMRTSIAPQAMINGDINFHTSPSSGIAAAASGLPLVVVLNLYNGTPWTLVTSKEMNRPQDFIGKKVAISGIRTSSYYFALAGFKKMGIDDKDVSFIFTGGTASSFAALTSNQVAAVVLSPPFDDKAISLGFKKFLFLGDLADIPYVGLVTTHAEIRGQRERVQKTAGALLEAVSWLRSNRWEGIKMIAEKFKLNQGEAEHSYDTLVVLMTRDGRLSSKIVRGYLDILRQERPVPPDLDPQKFTDFSMLPGR